jgi:hypothetical protein
MVPLGTTSVGLVRRSVVAAASLTDFESLRAGIHWSVYALILVFAFVLIGVRIVAGRVHDGHQRVSKMMYS